MQDKWSV